MLSTTKKGYLKSEMNIPKSFISKYHLFEVILKTGMHHQIRATTGRLLIVLYKEI